MKLSIIVPVYNAESTIQNCISSIQSQTFKDLEIICIDDGSTDNSLFILQKLASTDDRIRIIKQKNKGVATTRNTGLDCSTGELIGFVDSDDTVNPQMFESLIANMDKHSSDLAICGTNPILISGKPFTDFEISYLNPSIQYVKDIDQKLFYRINAFLWNKIFRHDLLLASRLKFPDGLWYEDSAFIWCYLTLCNSVSGIPDRLYNYHRTSTSIMGQTFSKAAKSLDHLRVLYHVESFIMSREKEDRYLNDFLELSFAHFMSSLRFSPIKYKVICCIEFIRVLNCYKLRSRGRLYSLSLTYLALSKVLILKFLNKLKVQFLGR